MNSTSQVNYKWGSLGFVIISFVLFCYTNWISLTNLCKMFISIYFSKLTFFLSNSLGFFSPRRPMSVTLEGLFRSPSTNSLNSEDGISIISAPELEHFPSGIPQVDRDGVTQGIGKNKLKGYLLWPSG